MSSSTLGLLLSPDPPAANLPNCLQDFGAIRVSTLTLVDLAGSERIAKTGAEGQRMKEVRCWECASGCGRRARHVLLRMLEQA